MAQIIDARPDSQIAALRTELADMNRWCERFNAAHDRTLARCAALEGKLSAANAEVARLREAAAKAEAAALGGEKEVLDEGKEEEMEQVRLAREGLLRVGGCTGDAPCSSAARGCSPIAGLG